MTSTRLLRIALLAACLAPAPLLAQEKLAPKELSEKTTASLGDLKKFTDAKDFAKALVLIDETLAAAKPGTYDLYLLSQIKAQILITQDKLADSIAPLEAALALSEANPNFADPAARAEQLNLLAQLHFQRGAGEKSAEAQRAGYTRALDYLNRYFAASPKPNAQAQLFAASLHYNLSTLGSGDPDKASLRAALGHCEEAMLLTPAPGSQLRLLEVACHLQLGQNARAAELLEVLAAAEPKTASTWTQLQALYLNLAADAKDPAEAKALNLRALHTLDRAQAQGLLVSQKDNYTRVAILFNLGQFARAAEMLETGLADGKIEPSQRNWELLANAYQQSNQEEKALDAFARAVARFPAQADLEFSLAQSLYAAGKLEDAYGRARSAVAKPGLSKPGQTRLYLAFLAYELQRMEEAQSWVEQARASGDVPAATLDPLARAVSDAMKAREALKNS